MRTVRHPNAAGVAWLVIVAALMGGSAHAALDAHYLGTSRDGGEFRIYLHGGEYLGRSGSFQAIRVTVHEERKRRALRASPGCIYHFDEADRSRDRIECSEQAIGSLRGVAYARERGTTPAAEVAPMVCVRRCSAQVPQRLRLEETDEDNG